MTRSGRESKIQRDVRLALGGRDDCIVWRNHTGAGIVLHERDVGRCPKCRAAIHPRQVFDGRFQRFGLATGSSDLIGIARIGMLGRFFALEIKGEKGRLTPEQQMFMTLVNNVGGYAASARSVEEALEHLAEAKR